MHRNNIKHITGIGIFTAIVIVLQLLGSFIKLGPFSISLVLIPIVVGGALYGLFAGAWLGFIFGLAVILSGDAASFLAVNVLGTIITVFAKGIMAGFISALIYKILNNKNEILATIISAISCPIINTGIFLIGCLLFFMPTIRSWAMATNFPNVGNYMLLGLVGMNFIAELFTNIILSPIIIKVIRLGNK